MANLVCKHGNLTTTYGGHCEECEAERAAKKAAANAKRRASSRATREAYASLGMVRVRGAMGGTYYE